METATVAEVARRAGLTTLQGVRFIRAIVGELAIGRRVRLGGLGEFRTTELGRRVVRSPILPTGRVVLAPRRTIRFRQFRSATRRVNES